jgi:hypothetical protein
VAFSAFGYDHISCVRFVAPGALRDLAVDVVAGGTLNGAVFALIFPEHSHLGCMTGNAIPFYVGKRNVQRRMRVLVTTAAAPEFEVGLLLYQMASIACLECLPGFRRVAQMAAHARNGSVFPSGSFYLIRCSGMALRTTLFSRGFSLSMRRAGTKREQGDPDGQH